MLRNAGQLAAEWIAPLLVCPTCRGDLDRRERTVRCLVCGVSWAQADGRVIDLYPPGFLAADRSRWRERQEEMTGEYGELVTDREHAILAYRSDYEPLAPILELYAGRIVDLGGGNGVVRHWLPAAGEYVVLDPSAAWLDQPWDRLADVFPCLGRPPVFVRGVAECPPFAAGSFAGVLAIWSLNHVSRPEDALEQAARILRPGGRLLVVLEDMPPTCGDLLSGRVATGRYPSQPRTERSRLAFKKLRSLATGWPVQPDHLRITESRLRRWIRPALAVVRRSWIGAYLVFELEKTAQI